MPHEAHPVVSRREGLWVAVLTAVFGLWLVLWAIVVPAFQAPDEPAHFDAAVHVATGSGWPAPGTLHVSNAVQAAQQEQTAGDASTWSTTSELLAAHPGDSTTVDQMTQHPPTAYALDALVLRAIHYGSLRWDHALVALRIVDALLVTPLALLAWAAVRRVTRSPRAALIAPLALFATPQLASIGASVTNDAPVLLLGGVVVWLATRLLTGDLRTRTLVALGVVTAALVWTKGTGLPAVPFAAVVALVSGAGVLSLRRRVVRTALLLGTTAVLGCWWWLHNLVTYHRLQPDGYAAIRPHADFPPGQHPSVLHFLDVSWGTVARTFWGSPGQRAQVSIGDLLTAVLTVVAVLVVLLWAFRRPRTGPDTRAAAWSLAVFPALLLLLQTASSARAYLDTTQVAGTQGRYVFPALLALVVLSALAWRRIPRTDRGRGVLATTVAVVAPAIGLYGLAVVSSWFWNGARGPLTASGIARYEAWGPVPFPLVVVVALLVAVGLVASVTQVVRTGRPGGAVPVARSARV
jgi:4-amino-4-deoxy-L-arabinose transferase-like glycosyltransferase